ncbi:recombinase family protein [Lentzea sp. NPDC102401]|uniref:recombinase family protein n=1 Tax=Lentzea sp. NPDC102401 TaxID=3364128 RepID=UPI00381308CA
MDQRGAAIYARQSKGKFISVQDQVKKGTERCAARSLPVFDTYRDKVSASRFGAESGKVREDWPRLVADVEAGRIGFVWLWDASRGDRTPETWHPFLSACRALKVLIYSERDDYAYRPWIPREWKTLADSGNDAAYESEIKSVDIRRGVDEAAIAGRPHGIAPYGYSREYDPRDRENFTQVPNEHAPIVEEIIRRVGARDPIINIARDLDARGVPTPNARDGGTSKWARQSIRQIANNLAYAGIRVHNGEQSQGNWQKIVSRKALESARSVLAEPDRKTSPPGALTYLLSYLMIGPHGDVNTHPSKGGRVPRYRCLADGCSSVGMPEADEYVTRVVLARLALPDARDVFDTNAKDMDDAYEKLGEVEAEARELEVEVNAGRMRPALAAQFDAGIQKRLTAARARVAALSGQAAAFALMGDGEFTAATARPRWDALSIAARRSIVSAVVREVRLLPKGEGDRPLTRWSTPADRLLMAEKLVNVSLR